MPRIRSESKKMSILRGENLLSCVNVNVPTVDVAKLSSVLISHEDLNFEANQRIAIKRDNGSEAVTIKENHKQDEFSTK